MNRLGKIFPLLAVLLVLGAANSWALGGFTDDNETPFEPFTSEKAELFRFSRSAKGGLFAKYEQKQREIQQQQAAHLEEQSPQVEVVNQQVAASLPTFGEVNGSQQQQVEVQQQQQQQPAVEVVQVPVAPSSESSTSSSASSSSSSSSASKSSHAKKVTTTTTTTTTTTVNQGEPQVARLQEVRVHTVPLSEAVHYANLVFVPSSAGTKAAHLEESSSSSSSSHRSSSSSTREESEAVAVAPAPAPPATVILPPAEVPLGPDCNVLQRLVIQRPVASSVVLQVPSEVSVHSSSSHSSRIVEAAAPAPAFYIKRVVTPVVTTARLVAPAPVAAPASNLREEKFHSESRLDSSLREESSGLGHSSHSSSSSSSSSSSHSSKSSTASHTATLLAPPAPTVTIVKSAPLIAVKAAAPIVALTKTQPASSYSVDVDHHYTGPNVKYGYSIKQQSVEPETKGVVVGERVVYLK